MISKIRIYCENCKRNTIYKRHGGEYYVGVDEESFYIFQCEECMNTIDLTNSDLELKLLEDIESENGE
ncbi:MAG: hypothetical protein ACP5D2_02440 [Candidatus Nanoarchaeia archaeon]